MHCRVTWTRLRYNFGCSTLEAFKTVCVALVTAGPNPITVIQSRSYKRVMQSVGCTYCRPSLSSIPTLLPPFVKNDTHSCYVTTYKRPSKGLFFLLKPEFSWTSINCFHGFLTRSDREGPLAVERRAKTYKNKTLSERTLGRRCITRMGGFFFMSGTCECRKVANC